MVGMNNEAYADVLLSAKLLQLSLRKIHERLHFRSCAFKVLDRKCVHGYTFHTKSQAYIKSLQARIQYISSSLHQLHQRTHISQRLKSGRMAFLDLLVSLTCISTIAIHHKTNVLRHRASRQNTNKGSLEVVHVETRVLLWDTYVLHGLRGIVTFTPVTPPGSLHAHCHLDNLFI